MKTKIAVDFHNDEGCHMNIADLVAKHNGGKVDIDKEFLRAFVKVKKMDYPNSNKFLEIINYGPDSVDITIREDKQPFVSLQWKEIHELAETEEQANVQLQNHLS